MKSINAKHKQSISRRGFLKGAFVAAAVVAAPRVFEETHPEEVIQLSLSHNLPTETEFIIEGVYDLSGNELQKFKVVGSAEAQHLIIAI